MNIDELMNDYRATRVFISLCFAMLMAVVGILSGIRHFDQISSLAVQAYDSPHQVFSSVIKGMAPSSDQNLSLRVF